MSDADDEDDKPRPASKKPARPPEGAVKKGAPPKKEAVARPIDDEDDEEEEVRRPIKKKPVRRRDDDDDEDDEPEAKTGVRENTALNVLAPVGGSVWGLGSMLCGVLATLVPVVLLILYWLPQWNAGAWLGKLGYAVLGLAACFGLLALPLGGLSFVFRPKKKSYGGITSYMRAIIGIVLGLVSVVLAAVVGYFIKGMMP